MNANNISHLAPSIPFYYRLRKLFGAKVVALHDYDGEVTYRVATVTPFNTLHCNRIADWGPYRVPITLLPDGSVTGCSWVKGWTLV